MHHTKNLHLKFKNKYPNLGLFYHKFTPPFKSDDKESKKKFLQEFSKIPVNLESLQKRIYTLKEFAHASITMENESPFLCGSGYTNTTEWGLSFDHTSGVPYLPGSSFKGVLLSYLEFCQENQKPVECWRGGDSVKLPDSQDEWTKEEILGVFGYQESSENINGKNIYESDVKSTGRIIFFDVYPTQFKGFNLNVITPHFGKYYANPKENPPADIYLPKPTYFLTIKPGSQFKFMFRFRGGKEDHKLKEKLLRLIEEAGNNYGFGAKTSGGYGYFRKVKSD